MKKNLLYRFKNHPYAQAATRSQFGIHTSNGKFTGLPKRCVALIILGLILYINSITLLVEIIELY